LRRLISIFLILLVAFNAGGYFFVYFQLENCFKQVAFNRINDYMPIEDLELIKINLNSINESFERVEDREFTLNGKMYDIYQEYVSNDTLYLYCVNDENEDMMHSAFASFINSKKNDTPNSAISNIIKIFITIALVPNIEKDILYNTNKNISFTFLTSLNSIIIEIPSPPPRFAS
jgi:hypothetical protein